MQGDVTSIIGATDNERSKIIDEIAGVADFDRRIDQATNELETVEQRVERSTVILNEVDNRLEQLKEEREVALKYQKLRDEKQGLEGQINKVRFFDIKRSLEKAHENILVFYKKLPTYNAQMTKGKPYSITRRDIGGQYLHNFESIETKNEGTRCPRDVLRDLWQPYCGGKMYHPTQKPVPLLEYLIKTYTNEGETVLDNCMGSGSTGVACVNTKRDFIGVELDENYFDIARRRINDTTGI